MLCPNEANKCHNKHLFGECPPRHIASHSRSTGSTMRVDALSACKCLVCPSNTVRDPSPENLVVQLTHMLYEAPPQYISSYSHNSTGSGRQAGQAHYVFYLSDTVCDRSSENLAVQLTHLLDEAPPRHIASYSRSTGSTLRVGALSSRK